MTSKPLPDPARVRAQLPATAARAYLNTGASGPLSQPAADAMAREAGIELVAGRAGLDADRRAGEQRFALRAALAWRLRAEPAEIALTRSTTDGLNTCVWGIPWQAGDRVVTTSLEHDGALLPLYQAYRRHDIKVVFVDIGNGAPALVLEAMRRAIEPGVRLVVLSHVSYATGALLPVSEIVQMAHRAGARVLVDGAQAVGAVHVDMAAMGADYYAFPGHKWLCGPEGTGGLFVHRRGLAELEPTWVGFLGIDPGRFRTGDPGTLRFVPTAARYESTMLHRPSVAGLVASLAWLDDLGWETVHATIADRTRYALARATELPGGRVLTPLDAAAGIASITIDGVDPAACVAFLASRDVAIRAIPHIGALRLSCSFFTTYQEIDYAIGLIDDYRRHG